MSKRPCSGKCIGGPSRGATRPTIPPRSQSRPRSVGPNSSRTHIQQSQYPRYGQGRIPIQPPVSRPRSALPIQRGPTPGAMRREPPRALPVARRSNLPVPYGQRMVRTQSGSRIPCPRSGIREPTAPTIIVNTRLPRPGQGSNDVNINIRLMVEPRSTVNDYEARELEEFERYERECEELEEFERLERQCELECANAGQAQVLDVVQLTPAESVQRYRDFINTQQGITESGSLRGLRRQQDRFNMMANRAAASPTLSSIRQPEFESPVADLYKTGSSWSSLVNQPGSMIEDESMGGNTFDRAMWDDTYDNVEGWDQVVAAAADDRYDLGNVSMNYESPGCC